MMSAAPLLLAQGLASCSLSVSDFWACSSHDDCRRAFGLGHVCEGDGSCREVEPLSRCSETHPAGLFDDRLAARDFILLGNLMDRSNVTHAARERAAQLAYDQANGEGGLDGRKFGVILCTIEEDPRFDALARPEAAIASAKFLAEVIGVQAILGPSASPDTQAVFQQLSGSGVLVISPAATSPTLQALDPADVSDESPGLLWRTAASDVLQGAVIARDMLTMGNGRTAKVEQVAAIHEVGPYGDGLFDVFAREFVARGGSLPTRFPYRNEGQRADAIAKVGELEADEVLFISSQPADIVAFLNGVANLPGYDTKGIFLTDAAANPDVLSPSAASSSRFPRLRGTRPAPREGLVTSSFGAAYSAAFAEDVSGFSFAAHAYDAAWLLMYGTAWALFNEGALTGQNMARGLRRVSRGRAIEMGAGGWVAVQQAFRAGRRVDVTGASGELDFNPDTEELTGDIEVWGLEGSAISRIYSVSP